MQTKIKNLLLKQSRLNYMNHQKKKYIRAVVGLNRVGVIPQTDVEI